MEIIRKIIRKILYNLKNVKEMLTINKKIKKDSKNMRSTLKCKYICSNTTFKRRGDVQF